jgi:NAD-dependent DNA ligase
MTYEEKLELYWRAKEAYYNGEEIMSDLEFDALEKELGLENKAAIGARHNPSYTIKHPFIMGSLSKVQIHKGDDGVIDWKKYFDEAVKYFGRKSVIITPKYDGCSFEIESNKARLLSISSRGDGEYGKDLTQHIQGKIPEMLFAEDNLHRIYRGEVLVKKSVFEEKYADEFTNPRSFVSGVLNTDYSDDEDFQARLADLDIIIYDLREDFGEGWHDQDWNVIKFNTTNRINKYDILPKFSIENTTIDTPEDLEAIYYAFEKYRKECEYALDGIVIKPIAKERINNMTEHRPKDCVAIKFVPMLKETEVIDITWKLGKTGELIPIIWVNPVEMDGRMVKKCSGSNYGNLVAKRVSIGSKIIMSLAGDIIPFLYKVTNTDNFSIDKLNTPDNTYLEDIHLMKVLTEEEKAKNAFINSTKSLNIPNIGTEIAAKIFTYMTEEDEVTMEFFGDTPKKMPWNILELTPEDVYYGAGGGKTGNNVKKAFVELLKNITLKDIIASCSFKLCGRKVSEQCAAYIINGEADFEHLAKEGYEWVFNETSQNRVYLNNILEKLGMDLDTFRIKYENETQAKSNQIPIIMTGEPTTCSTKAEFLKLHPEYRNTGSWKEVQIVFTNSMDSNTGKMKKAREKGIEIRLY